VKHQVVQLAEAVTSPTLQDRSASHRAADLCLLLLVVLAATHSIRIARYGICITASRIKTILATEAEKPLRRHVRKTGDFRKVLSHVPLNVKDAHRPFPRALRRRNGRRQHKKRSRGY
jgi:hypothetical protein